MSPPIIVDELNVAPGEAAVRDTHQDIMRTKGPVIGEGGCGAASLLNCVGVDFHEGAVRAHESRGGAGP